MHLRGSDLCSHFPSVNTYTFSGRAGRMLRSSLCMPLGWTFFWYARRMVPSGLDTSSNKCGIDYASIDPQPGQLFFIISKIFSHVMPCQFIPLNPSIQTSHCDTVSTSALRLHYLPTPPSPRARPSSTSHTSTSQSSSQISHPSTVPQHHNPLITRPKHIPRHLNIPQNPHDNPSILARPAKRQRLHHHRPLDLLIRILQIHDPVQEAFLLLIEFLE